MHDACNLPSFTGKRQDMYMFLTNMVRNTRENKMGSTWVCVRME